VFTCKAQLGASQIFQSKSALQIGPANPKAYILYLFEMDFKVQGIYHIF